MKAFSVTLKQYMKRVDYWIVGAAVGMTLLSILTLYAGMDRFGTKRPLVQGFAMMLGLAVLFFCSLSDIQPYYEKLRIPLYILSLGMIGLVILIGTGASAGTWLKLQNIGLAIQPSEFVKCIFLITFSQHLKAVRGEINKIKNVIFLAIHAGLIAGLITVSGDLGSALVFIAMAALMLYMAGLSLWYFAAAAVIIVIAFPIAWNFLADYQQERIIYGFNPELDPLDRGFQPLMSKAAIISGGFRGAGVDGGTYYQIIPAAQSDMLFGVLAEKFGFFGTAAYIVLFCLLVFRLMAVSRRLSDPGSQYICIGVAAMIMAQGLENIGMCLATLPVVGITLPFFSYGGSSLLSMFISLGLVENAITHNNKFMFERESLALGGIV